MTNWEKIEPTLKKIVPDITSETLSKVIFDSLFILNQGRYACKTGCAAYQACVHNDQTCWENIKDWLEQEAVDE